MNDVKLLGRLTRNPELRYTSTNNVPVCKFGLAVNREFSKNNEVDFINIVAWDKTADFCSKYFVKGQQVVISGRIQTGTYDNEDGKKVYTTDVIAQRVYFADRKREKVEGVKNANDNEGFYPVDDGEDDLPF